MNPTIEALLELHIVDQKRQALRRARRAKGKVANDAAAAAQAKSQDSEAVTNDLERTDALSRQYTDDVKRCDETIESLRAKQMEAKTNKEYMAIINQIEQLRLEKTHREQSLTELGIKRAAMTAKVEKAALITQEAKATHDAAHAAAKAAETPSAEEAKLDVLYANAKTKVDPAFLEAYERLANAGIKMPMVRVDNKTRSTPWGAVISLNQLEQIKMGKLVIATGTNQILYAE